MRGTVSGRIQLFQEFRKYRYESLLEFHHTRWQVYKRHIWLIFRCQRGASPPFFGVVLVFDLHNAEYISILRQDFLSDPRIYFFFQALLGLLHKCDEFGLYRAHFNACGIPRRIYTNRWNTFYWYFFLVNAIIYGTTVWEIFHVRNHRVCVTENIYYFSDEKYMGIMYIRVNEWIDTFLVKFLGRHLSRGIW